MQNITTLAQAATFNLPIFQEHINGEPVQTVNAQDLHSELGSKRQFANWISERIEKYGFVEGEDFLTILLKTSTGGRPTKEYHRELTKKGKGHAEVIDTGKKRSNGTPVKQIKWFKTVVEEI